MEHDSSLGTEWRLRNRGLPNDLDEPELRHGRPAPSIRRERPDPRRGRRSEPFFPDADVHSLAASLPLFLIGAACTGFGVFVRLENPHAVIDRIPLWLPLVAIGGIALLGGILSFFASAEEPVDSLEAEPPRRSVARPARRPAPPARLVPSEPEVDHDSEPEAAPPTTRRFPDPPASSRGMSGPPARPGTAAGASEIHPILPDDDSESLASLLDELDSIDGDLRTPPAPSPRQPVAPTSTAAVDADAAAIDAELADLLDQNSPRTPPPRPAPSRLAVAPRLPTVHCVECGAPIEGPAAPGRCHGCDEPLCPDCRTRSVSEGKPDLCVFCSVLDEFQPKGTASPAGERS